MTTLPTTSSIRLPRSGGPGGQVLAMPGTPMAPIALPASQVLLTPADIWRIIRGNIWLIVISVAVFLAGGILLWWLLQKYDPKYMSVGVVQVNRSVRVNPATGNAEDVNGGTINDFNLNIEQRTQTMNLTNQGLFDEVLEKNTNIRRTSWFQEFEAEAKKQGVSAVRLAKEDLASNFSANAKPDTKNLVVSMQAASAEDARDILQTIVDAHIRNQQQVTFDKTNTELETAKQWRERYVRLMSQTKDRMNGLQADLSTAGSMTAQSRLSMKEMEVSALIGEQSRARLEAAQAAAQFDAVQQQLGEGKDPFQVDLFIRADANVQYLQRSVDEYEMQIATLEQTSGSNARAVKDLRVRRDVARAKLEKATGDARATARTQLLESNRSMMSEKRAQVEAIDARVDSLRNELGEISAKYSEFASLQDEYTGYKELQREMNERIAVLGDALRQQVASVSWAPSGTPTRPDELSFPNLKLFIPASIVLGLAFSIGIAFLRELMDTTVRSPRDISRVGPMNLLGMISSEIDDPQLAGVPLHLVISQSPHSMLAEQFRQVRTRLQHAASLDTTRTIVITSPGPQDGKTTVACNLAAGLALNGRRILLVDANFRRPELHKLFGTPNEVGFANVLDSVATLESVVQKTQIPNLELLPTGAKPANPTELIESQLFSDFIDRALEEYDHVIFDTGPLLVVSEAVALAPRVDGVITVVRAKKNTRGMLSRVRDTLKQIKAENLGVVLNGVRTWGGGYYARTIKTYYAYQNTD